MNSCNNYNNIYSFLNYNVNKNINKIINTTIDDYFLNPVRYKSDINRNDNSSYSTINTINAGKHNSKETRELVDIINNLTNLVVSKSSKNDNNNLDNLKSNSINLNDNENDNFNPLLFKYVANDNINSLENTLKTNKKININEQDKDGDTPLHISVFLSNIKSVKILLNYGAIITIKDKWGQTPLHRICFSMGEDRTFEILELFIKYNKKDQDIFLIQDNYGNTVCHLVLKHIIKNKTILNQNHKKLIEKLISLTDKKIKNIDGHTIDDLIKILDKNKLLN